MSSWACRVWVVAAALLLTSCGGGGDLVDPFEPTRQLSFGDEMSAMTDDGHNYGINGFDDKDVFDCTVYPNWVQLVARGFGLVFEQCKDATSVASAFLYAAPGAKVADVVAQIDAFLATDAFSSDDLVTVAVGTNDVLEQYALYPGVDEATLIARLRTRGEQLAAQVNRVADLDGRIIVATVPDLGLSPFGVAEETANAGRAALLSRLTAALNARMRANIVNDGRRVGLALADEMVQAVVKRPSPYGFRDAKRAACTVSPPLCTSKTLVDDDDITPSNWLWASPTMLSAGGQRRLGLIAEQRAKNNPF